MAEIVRKLTAEAKAAGRPDYLLSDASVDRYGDIIKSEGWQLDNFRRNPIALFNHHSDFVIGKWKNIRVADNALRGSLELAPEGTSDRVDEIRRLVDADVLIAVSVGFSPIEYKPRKDSDSGYVYEKCELVETSLVSVPANANALLQVKRLKISDETQALIFKNNKPTKRTTKTAPKTQRRTEAQKILDRAYETLARSTLRRGTTKAEADEIAAANAVLLGTDNSRRTLHQRRLIMARGRLVAQQPNPPDLPEDFKDRLTSQETHERAKQLLERMSARDGPLELCKAIEQIENAVAELMRELDYLTGRPRR